MEKIIFKNGEAPYLSDNTLMEMQTNIETAIAERTPTIELLTVSATAPTICAIGDKYYNTTTSKIYTATATNTWGTTGEDPSNLYLYADIEHKELYYYDGTDFKSYGSGKKEVGYANEPLEGTEVILLEESDFAGENSIELAKVEQNLSSNSEDKVPSVKAVNDGIKTNITTGQEVATNEYIDGKQVFVKRINLGSLPNANEKIVTTDLNVNNVNIIKIDGIAYGSATSISYILTLPDINPLDYSQATRLTMDTENNIWRVKIRAGVDRSNYTGYVNIYYTKN